MGLPAFLISLPPNGKYYVRFTCNGKEVRRSLRTAIATWQKALRLMLGAKRRDRRPQADKITLAQPV